MSREVLSFGITQVLFFLVFAVLMGRIYVLYRRNPEGAAKVRRRSETWVVSGTSGAALAGMLVAVRRIGGSLVAREEHSVEMTVGSDAQLRTWGVMKSWSYPMRMWISGEVSTPGRATITVDIVSDLGWYAYEKEGPAERMFRRRSDDLLRVLRGGSQHGLDPTALLREILTEIAWSLPGDDEFERMAAHVMALLDAGDYEGAAIAMSTVIEGARTLPREEHARNVIERNREELEQAVADLSVSRGSAA
jgi:hypothetical protein